MSNEVTWFAHFEEEIERLGGRITDLARETERLNSIAATGQSSALPSGSTREQRRYEIARDVMAAQINPTNYMSDDELRECASLSVRAADALLDALEGKR